MDKILFEVQDFYVHDLIMDGSGKGFGALYLSVFFIDFLGLVDVRVCLVLTTVVSQI